MRYFFLFVGLITISSCGQIQSNIPQIGSSQKPVTENTSVEKTSTGIVSESEIGSSIILPEAYTKFFSDKKTGIEFYYPNNLSLQEINESAGWEISSTGAKINEEWSHELTISGTKDKTRIYMVFPDNTNPSGGAPHVWISENQIIEKGYTLERKLAWVTQDGTGATDDGSWEITYAIGDKSIQLIQDNQIYGTGYKNTISEESESIAKNILIQLSTKKELIIPENSPAPILSGTINCPEGQADGGFGKCIYPPKRP